MQGSVLGDRRLQRFPSGTITDTKLVFTDCVPCVRDPNRVRQDPVPFIMIEEGSRGSAKGLTFAQSMTESQSIFWSKEEGTYEEGT